MERFTQAEIDQIESMTEEEFARLMEFIVVLKRQRENVPA
jgi:hypothetical protein